jgi:hypothetical protein
MNFGKTDSIRKFAQSAKNRNKKDKFPHKKIVSYQGHAIAGYSKASK